MDPAVAVAEEEEEGLVEVEEEVERIKEVEVMLTPLGLGAPIVKLAGWVRKLDSKVWSEMKDDDGLNYMHVWKKIGELMLCVW